MALKPTLDKFLEECSVLTLKKNCIPCNITKEEKERIINEFSEEAKLYEGVDNGPKHGRFGKNRTV